MTGRHIPLQDDFVAERRAMVQRQIAARGVANKCLLAAMQAVPRHVFVPEISRSCAYDDRALPIAADQTISQPYILARMIALLEVNETGRVLEIGSGSGYAAAVLSRMAAYVYAVEWHDELVERARDRLADLGYANVEMRTGDGRLGWPDAAPFDAILVSAGGPELPEDLIGQLAPGGRMVMPIGAIGKEQRLVRWTRGQGNALAREEYDAVRFVPLLGT